MASDRNDRPTPTGVKHPVAKYGITGHRLSGPNTRYVDAHDHGGPLAAHTFGIIHYTGGSSLAGAVKTLSAYDDRYVSSHLVIGRDGEVVQLVPFNLQAWHAGVSAYGGHTRLNNRSIGIEVVNPGFRRPGTPADWPMISAPHKSGGPLRDWYLYTSEQVIALRQVISAIDEAYGRLQWLGHDDVSPGRKLDPGPAFPWDVVRA